MPSQGREKTERSLMILCMQICSCRSGRRADFACEDEVGAEKEGLKWPHFTDDDVVLRRFCELVKEAFKVNWWNARLCDFARKFIISFSENQKTDKNVAKSKWKIFQVVASNLGSKYNISFYLLISFGKLQQNTY